MSAPFVVVGSGFGGLAAAVRLRAMGHPVVLIEANDQLGGRASVFRDQGFTFDAGPTVITAPYLLDELFQLVGRDPRDYYELLPVDPFYRVVFPEGGSFDYVGDQDRLLEQIRAISPDDVDGYLRMADHARRIFDVGYTKLADQPFDRLSDMLRVVPSMIKLRSDRTVWQLACKYLKDHRLRQVFTFQPLLVGGSPLRTSSIYLLIHWLERKWGVFFPRGGTGALVQALADLLQELGVEIRTEAPVEEIEVENGRAVAVRLASGERIAARGVVFNGDPSHAYTKLVAAEHRRVHTDRKVAGRTPSMSLFVTYVGAAKQWPDLAHHTILLGPRYEGLLDDLFVHKRLAEDFSLYLHRPTATDPSLAPEGSDALYVLSPVPNDRSGIDWAERAPEYEDRILSALEARAAAQAARGDGHQALDRSPVLRRPAPLRRRRGVRARAHAAAVGLLPLPQPVGGRGRAVLRRRVDPPRRRRARRPELGARAGARRAGARARRRRGRAARADPRASAGLMVAHDRVAAAAEAHAVLQQHARTFSAAAAWLAPATYDAIASVYLFCRTVDDLADEPDTADPEALDRLVAELRGERAAGPLAGRVLALAPLGVPIDAAVHLVEGCRSDLGRVRVPDPDAVVRYGYLVAGTVGRMVSPLLGVRDPRAEPFAVDLGVAMQLSNIARDVGEDAARDRIYLPASWLAEAGLSEGDVLQGGRDEELAAVVQRLLDLAETYYASSDRGLRWLPWRARLAVALASRRYRGIGRRVRRRGAAAVRDRTVLGPVARAGFFVRGPAAAALQGLRRPVAHDDALHRPLVGLFPSPSPRGAP
ncbi:MAG: phytoene desaturase family protein [Myxococcota bacterium]